jgi:hypothetical protein
MFNPFSWRIKTMAKKKAKKKAAKKTAKKGGKKKDVLVVASKVKNYIRSKGMMCSADAVQAMSDQIYCCLDRAMARTEANRRSTVKPQDL